MKKRQRTVVELGIDFPESADLSDFADRMTELVETFGGRLGGGVTGAMPAKSPKNSEPRYIVREWVLTEREAPEIVQAEVLSATEAAALCGVTHVNIIQAAEHHHWAQVIDRQERNPRKARRYFRKDVQELLAKRQNAKKRKHLPK